MAGKELDSNFFIFLPQCFTNDPVSDIEKGSRNSCYAGEHLCFFLIAQFRGKNRSDAKFQAWQKRLLRLCSCVSVSSIDLMIRKDEAPTGGFITCWPISSFKMEGKETNLYKEKIEPKITSRGDIIYPLNVVLDSLPALTRRMRLSVNVWTPELDAFQAEPFQKGDFKRYLVNHDPEELIEESRNAWRCIVNATLPVVTPPTLRCKYFQVASKHFLCIEVINTLGKSVNVCQVDVHASSDIGAENARNMIHNQVHSAQHLKPKMFSCLDVFPVSKCENLSSKHPIFLRPWEHYAFLFRIIHHESQLGSHKHLEVALKGSITWDVETLRGWNHEINTTYSLPVFLVRRSSVSVRATCQSCVSKGKRFQVKYTVTNTERDDGNVSLVWSPVNNHGMTKAQHISSAEQSVVCLQPQVRIGCCPSGSSLTVKVEFLAVQEGLHEVGKFMKCQWHSEMDGRVLPDHLAATQNMPGFTTVSHSCQVFVTNG
ncbi:unnamed protein product [Porites evermanni]|uniref:Uncharacterized protein n=1 Tax=Porites evermanni TaxID=104178 RepID=A0ABN8LU32_9CNID|nr:unnamed protein product [Porites evermanni]